MVQAIHSAMDVMLERDRSVVLLGEDIGYFGGVFRATEGLQRKYGEKGLTVLGFPCNQFGAQEPGDAAEIANFCSLNYDVSFPLMAKVEVNGDKAEPLYDHLKSAKPGLLGTKAIKWNFTKFLIDKNGKVVGRYAPTDKPESIEKDIQKLL